MKFRLSMRITYDLLRAICYVIKIDDKMGLKDLWLLFDLLIF